ncbi:MAG: hypothetical protein Q7J34_05870 [Bacteroidales bacterium]|jgi:hypothetical protein|nr:hypothetical protein [Bacteroidales bacterium]
MNLENLLIKELSKANIDFVGGLAIQDEAVFEELWSLFLSNRDPASRRAAWVIDTLSEETPKLIEKRIDEIIEALPYFIHPALRRHSLRMLRPFNISEKHLGFLTGFCFEHLLKASEPPAVKVHCMDILMKISETEPSIKRELSDSIRWRMHEESPGFQNRALKYLTKLEKDLAEEAL